MTKKNKMNHRPGIVWLDIETAPAEVYVYGLFNQNIGIHQIKKDPRIICFSWQIEGQKKTHFASEYHNGGQRGLMKELYKVRELASDLGAIGGYNSQRFDVPWIDGELAKAGYPILPPVKHVDLLSVFRRNTRLISRKLDFVSQKFLDDQKVDVNTMKLALACQSSNKEEKVKAWRLMKKYSIQDTALLPRLYEIVKPWVKLPFHVDPYTVGSCPKCGHIDLKKNGIERRIAGDFQRLQCKLCKTHIKGQKLSPMNKVTQI